VIIAVLRFPCADVGIIEHDGLDEDHVRGIGGFAFDLRDAADAEAVPRPERGVPQRSSLSFTNT